MVTPSVLISVLNWNKADVTFECLESVKTLICDGMKVDILVIDNGSDAADYSKLQTHVAGSGVKLRRLEKNLGFTGGQNVSLKAAVEENYDYVWMLNNDAIVKPDTLLKLVEALAADSRCGAVSPLVCPEESGPSHNAWGLMHDWKSRCSVWFSSEAEARRQQQEHPENMCVAGTANLFRVQAIREVGLLDDRLFAYWDDNDIGVRLARGGWFSKVLFDATVTHGLPAQKERPLYFFYLMFRNELIFWHTHMPKELRKLLWLKLVNQGLFNVNRLRLRGLERQAESALLGVSDFIFRRYGAQDLNRKVPFVVRLMCRASAYVHRDQLRVGLVPPPPSALAVGSSPSDI